MNDLVHSASGSVPVEEVVTVPAKIIDLVNSTAYLQWHLMDRNLMPEQVRTKAQLRELDAYCVGFLVGKAAEQMARNGGSA